jgi:hypothetical protein
MNLADLETFMTILGALLMAGMAMVTSGAGPFHWLVPIAWLLGGAGVSYGVRRLAYFILKWWTSKTRTWFIEMVVFGAYIFLPISAGVSGLTGIGLGTDWLVKHAL